MNTSHIAVSKFKSLSVSRLLITSIGSLLIILVALSLSFRADAVPEEYSVWDSLGSHEEDRVITLADVTGRNKDARVFLVGEMHTRYDHHLTQLEILKTLYQQYPKLAIGVEWFQQPFQPHLDAFIRGTISEAEMLHNSEYYNRWRYDYRLYRPILEFARQNKIPVLALNASSELSNQLKSDDITNLPDDLKNQIPASYDWSDKNYEERLRQVFEQHPEYPGTFEQFFRGQLTWDEAMSYRSARFLFENPEHRLVVFAGTGHIEYGSGIPNRIPRHIDVETVSIIPTDDFANLDNSRADYFIQSRHRNLPAVGLMGAFLDEKNNNLIVKKFSNNSALHDAGLVEGIAIVGVDDNMVSNLTEFKIAMFEKRAGDTIKLHYLDEPGLDLSLKKMVDIRLK